MTRWLLVRGRGSRPLPATGWTLERREARYGVACMCIGFGQAIAAVVERL